MSYFLPVIKVVTHFPQFVIIFYLILISAVVEGGIKMRRSGFEFDDNFTRYLDYVINSTKIQSAAVFMNCVTECQDVAKSCIEKLNIPLSINGVGTVTDNSLVIMFEHKLSSMSSFFEKLSVVKYPTFLVVWMCPDCSIDEAGLRRHFEYFWKHNFTSVRAVVEQPNNDLKIYGFYPYSPSHCGVVGPVLELEQFSSRNKILVKNISHDATLKVNNLHGCPLTIHARNRPPDTGIVELGPEQYVYAGCGGMLLKTAMEKLNFSAVFSDLKKSVLKGSVFRLDVSNNEDICCNGLLNQTIDIVVGTLTMLLFYKETRVELTRPIAQDCFQFYTPCGLSSIGFMAKSASYSKAFSSSVWIMISLCVALVVILMSKIGKLYPKEHRTFSVPLANLFYLHGAFLNISLPLKPKSTPLRVLFAHVFFSFLIISVVFEAYVKSYRSTISPDQMNIKDLNEIRRLNLKVGFTPQAYMIWNNTSDGKMGNLLTNIRVAKNGTFDDLVDRVVLERDAAVFGPERLIEYYSFNREEHKSQQQDNRMSTCPVRPCVYTPYISQFILKKGSFLVDHINGLIQRLQESGIIQKWWSMSDPFPKKKRVFQAGVVTIKEMLSNLYILGFGLGLSVMVFFAELAVFNYKKLYKKYHQTKVKIVLENVNRVNNVVLTLKD